MKKSSILLISLLFISTDMMDDCSDCNDDYYASHGNTYNIGQHWLCKDQWTI